MINPINDLVVLKKIEKTKTTLSGIVIPDNASGEPNQGEVIAVGPGLKNEAGVRDPLTVKVGDRVFYQEHAGQSVKVDGVELLIVKESEILAVFE